MKIFAIILLAFCLTSPLLAQNVSDSAKQKTNQNTPIADSTLLSQSHHISRKMDSIGRLPSGLVHVQDSLKPDLIRYHRKLDSVKRKLTHRIDSLNRLNLSTTLYKHLLDSINKAGPVKDIKAAEAKLVQLENKVNQPFRQVNASINKAENVVNQKLALVNKEAGQGANLPGNGNLPKLQVPGMNSGTLPNLNVPQGSIPGSTNPLGQGNGLTNSNLQIPGMNPGGLPNSNLNLPSNELNGVSKMGGEMNNITGTPQKEMGQLKNEVQLGQVQKEMGQVNGYSKDLKQISKGNVDSVKLLNKTLENKAMQMGGADVKQFQGGTNQLDQYKGIVGKGNDPEAMKKLAIQEVQKEAVNHFAGKEKELQMAMSQISKLKQKYSSVSSLKDLKKLSRNQMHGKPVIERIVPGINFQVQIRNHFLIDLNQQVGYRITKRFMAGTGWNERVTVQHHHFSRNDRIYGPRTFAEFKITQNFAVRGEVEKMNVYVPSILASPNDEGGRQWVWGVFLGIKKDYKFSKYIRGNVQTMYNFTDRFYKTSPYADRINVRIGFEFPMKKNVKTETK